MIVTEKTLLVVPHNTEIFAEVERHIVGYDAVWFDIGVQHFVRTYCLRPQKAVQRPSEPSLPTYQDSRRKSLVALNILRLTPSGMFHPVDWYKQLPICRRIVLAKRRKIPVDTA